MGGKRPVASAASVVHRTRRVGNLRSTFSDWTSEVSPFSSELRETALAHTIGNRAEAAYRRGDALEKRRAMMEAWAQWREPKAGNVLAFAKVGGAL
jgi:anti-sigma-K factor RskA